MKILYLTPGCFDKGGISRYSRYQITALRELFGPSSVKVLSLLGPTSESFEEEFEVLWAAGGNGKLHKFHFITRAIAEVLIWQPQIIHTAHVNFSGFAYFLARLSGATTVLNIYGLEVWSGLSLVARYGLRRSNYVISDCHFTAEYLESEGLRKKGSTFVIWDCADIEWFSPGLPNPEILNRYGIPNPKNHFIVMTLGRLSFDASHKGYDRLINVLADVFKAYPNARLVIAGQGDMVDALSLQAKNLQIRDKVIFTGPIAEADLSEVYRTAHVFSLVSDRGIGRGEGIPLTPLEAMACGVPIIVGNQDGSREAVRDGINGYVIDPFDLSTHIEIIKTLIQDEKLRSRLSIGAVNHARQFFSYEDYREKHKKLYMHILNIKKANNIHEFKNI